MQEELGWTISERFAFFSYKLLDFFHFFLDIFDFFWISSIVSEDDEDKRSFDAGGV